MYLNTPFLKLDNNQLPTVNRGFTEACLRNDVITMSRPYCDVTLALYMLHSGTSPAVCACSLLWNILEVNPEDQRMLALLPVRAMYTLNRVPR